jgi:hypothetical protein
MDCCRFYTQYYISYSIYKCEIEYSPYITITSETNDHNLPLFDTPGYWSLEPLLPCYESPQKSSLYVKTLPNEDGLSLDQTIWNQHGQVWTLMGRV